jgi:sugar lactone lactonase YvrE
MNNKSFEYNGIKLEVVYPEKLILGEGPYYDPRFKRLSWVDIENKKLFYSKDGAVESVDVHQRIGAAIPMADSDGFVLALEDGLYIYRDNEISLLEGFEGIYKDYWRSNDAKADSKGRIWFDAMVKGEGHAPEGNLYCYDKGQIRCIVEGTKIANGMAWNSDKTRFYFSDSAKHTVSVFDYDEKSGNISNRKVLFVLEDGVPDGMTIDSEDNLWVAVWGGSRVEKRSGKTGELLQTIQVPAKQTSSCCFGGDDMMTLYITSAGIGQTGEYDGCLFKVRTDVKGVAPDLCIC